ncbi:hypothetical protein BCD48_00190 [Pseudofrankia sp. BMG5.36]|nr:hypothetical protein BCD48_00190 [Pseudofrankia sp. BMG5.36]
MRVRWRQKGWERPPGGTSKDRTTGNTAPATAGAANGGRHQPWFLPDRWQGPCRSATGFLRIGDRVPTGSAKLIW